MPTIEHDQPEGIADFCQKHVHPFTEDPLLNAALPFVSSGRPKKKRHCQRCGGFMRSGKTGDHCDTCAREIKMESFRQIPAKFGLKPGGGRDKNRKDARMGIYAVH